MKLAICSASFKFWCVLTFRSHLCHSCLRFKLLECGLSVKPELEIWPIIPKSKLSSSHYVPVRIQCRIETRTLRRALARISVLSFTMSCSVPLICLNEIDELCQNKLQSIPSCNLQSGCSFFGDSAAAQIGTNCLQNYQLPLSRVCLEIQMHLPDSFMDLPLTDISS